MKTILKKNPLYKSFDFDDENDNLEQEVASIRYKKFLEENYTIDGDTTFYEKDGKIFVDVKGHVKVKNLDITSLVEDNLRFGYVTGNFNCSQCKQLISLEGAPEKIKGGFYCWDCYSLKTLEGATPLIHTDFNCGHCHSLVSLEGGPKTVFGTYSCGHCTSLITLKGAPGWVGGDFYCKGCKSLVSFKGKPKIIGGRFTADKIKNQKSIVESFGFNSEEDEDYLEANIEFFRYKKFLDDNYEITGEIKPYKKDGELFIDVDGNVSVKNLNITALTNGNFRFGEVLGDFECPNCMSLQNFQGGPSKVGGNFDCEMCGRLYSFNGAPKWIGGDLNCWGCENIFSYYGLPDHIGGRFDTHGTSLPPLEEAVSESFDFNQGEESFDKIINDSKMFALIRKAVQESIEISIEKVPGKIRPYEMKENIKNLSDVVEPLRNLIKSIDSSNDIVLKPQLDEPLGAKQIWCDIVNGEDDTLSFVDSSLPAAPMYMGRFIHKIYLIVLHKLGLIKDLSEFTSMIKEETKILYSL